MKCAVWDCLNDSLNRSAKLSFFSFPKDEEILKKWLNFCKSNKKRKTKSDKICMKHFKDEDIEGYYQFEMGFRSTRYLKPGAVPTIPTSKMEPELEKVKQNETITSILREYGINGERKVSPLKSVSAFEAPISKNETIPPIINKFVSPIKRAIYSNGSSRNIPYKSLSITKKRVAIPIVRKNNISTKPKTSTFAATVNSEDVIMPRKKTVSSMVNKVDVTTKRKISASKPAIFTVDPLMLKKQREVSSVLNKPKTPLLSPAPSVATNTSIPVMSKKEAVRSIIIIDGVTPKRKTSPSTPANSNMNSPITKKKKEVEISKPPPAPTVDMVVSCTSKKKSEPSIADTIVVSNKQKGSSNAPASEIIDTSPTIPKKQVAVPKFPEVSLSGKLTSTLRAAAVDIEDFLPPVSKITNPKASLDPLKLDDVVIKIEDDKNDSLNNIKESNLLPHREITTESNICIKQEESIDTDPKLKILDYGANMQELESLRNEVKALKRENDRISQDKAALQRQIITLKDDNRKLYYHLMRNNEKHMQTLVAFEKSVSDPDVISRVKIWQK